MWVGRVACSLAHARFLVPFASKGVPGLSMRGGKTRGARGWRRQRRRGGAEAKGPRRRRRSARLDGDEGGEAERARRTATRGAVRAEERGEATDGGGRRLRKGR